MRKISFQKGVRLIIFLLFLSAFVLLAACGSSTKPDTKVKDNKPKSVENKKNPDTSTESNPVKRITSNGPTIKIKENSPADTIKVFYDRLREKKFRDAMRLTNLAPAVQGLTEDDMKELGADFGFLAQRVPEKMPINGEIITGNSASVTVRMPNEETKKLEVQEIKLRKENKTWVILVADKDGERMAKKEGKNYFFALRMDVHHKEAKAMLDRIGKAQMIYSMQNGGKFTDLSTLVKKGFVPEDAQTSTSTGYSYDVKLPTTRATYTALATPAVYGKTGRLSFALKITRERQPELIGKDLRGKEFTN